MNLSRYEKETIILYNEGEQLATVDTCNPTLIKRMDKYCAQNHACTRIKKDEYGAKYTCPKGWVKVQMPRQLTDEQRQKLSSRAKRSFGLDKSEGEEG